ncbi:MAG: TlpA family protein disulfide reductase [Bacteroidetes bacterium]|nr:TlpA family protein disulfide reductase [Bacteroidota bacterium]
MKQVTLYFLVLLTAASCGPVKEKDGRAVQLSDIELYDLTGNAVNPDDYKGKRIFLNFWATWCGPCIQEMPSIAAARQILNGKPIEFLLASDEEMERILKFTEKKNFDLPFAQVRNMDAFNINALPTTFIFDQDGNLEYTEMGARDWSTEEALELITGNKK